MMLEKKLRKEVFMVLMFIILELDDVFICNGLFSEEQNMGTNALGFGVGRITTSKEKLGIGELVDDFILALE